MFTLFFLPVSFLFTWAQLGFVYEKNPNFYRPYLFVMIGVLYIAIGIKISKPRALLYRIKVKSPTT